MTTVSGCQQLQRLQQLMAGAQPQPQPQPVPCPSLSTSAGTGKSGGGSTTTTTTTTTTTETKKKTKKPKRCMTAYNFFFQDQRQTILMEMERQAALAAAKQNAEALARARSRAQRYEDDDEDDDEEDEMKDAIVVDLEDSECATDSISSAQKKHDGSSKKRRCSTTNPNPNPNPNPDDSTSSSSSEEEAVILEPVRPKKITFRELGTEIGRRWKALQEPVGADGAAASPQLLRYRALADADAARYQAERDRYHRQKVSAMCCGGNLGHRYNEARETVEAQQALQAQEAVAVMKAAMVTHADAAAKPSKQVLQVVAPTAPPPPSQVQQPTTGTGTGTGTGACAQPQGQGQPLGLPTAFPTPATAGGMMPMMMMMANPLTGQMMPCMMMMAAPMATGFPMSMPMSMSMPGAVAGMMAPASAPTATTTATAPREVQGQSPAPLPALPPAEPQGKPPTTEEPEAPPPQQCPLPNVTANTNANTMPPEPLPLPTPLELLPQALPQQPQPPQRKGFFPSIGPSLEILEDFDEFPAEDEDPLPDLLPPPAADAAALDQVLQLQLQEQQQQQELPEPPAMDLMEDKVDNQDVVATTATGIDQGGLLDMSFDDAAIAAIAKQTDEFNQFLRNIVETTMHESDVGIPPSTSVLLPAKTATTVHKHHGHSKHTSRQRLNDKKKKRRRPSLGGSVDTTSLFKDVAKAFGGDWDPTPVQIQVPKNISFQSKIMEHSAMTSAAPPSASQQKKARSTLYKNFDKMMESLETYNYDSDVSGFHDLFEGTSGGGVALAKGDTAKDVPDKPFFPALNGTNADGPIFDLPKEATTAASTTGNAQPFFPPMDATAANELGFLNNNVTADIATLNKMALFHGRSKSPASADVAAGTKKRRHAEITAAPSKSDKEIVDLTNDDVINNLQELLQRQQEILGMNT